MKEINTKAITLVPEVQVLRVLLNKTDFDLYRKDIDLVGQDVLIGRLYRALDALHESGAAQYTLGDLKALWGLQEGSTKLFEPGILVLDQLEAVDVSETTCSRLIKSIRDRSVLQRIAQTAFEVGEGKSTISSLTELVHGLEQSESCPSDDSSEKFVTDDLDELYDNTVARPGLRWRLQTLNRMLGSLRVGDFGFVFARPETGKTTFLASEVTHMAGQGDPDSPVIWINNEERGDKVMVRCYQAALGLSLVDLMRDKQKAKKDYHAATGNQIKLIDDAGCSKQTIQRILEKHRPKLLVIDQIDKIKGFDADREDLRLGAIYIWARELAKKYCPVIGVCQADGTGQGVKWLTMAHVANAKTSKQAEADWILGIGKQDDPSYEYVRHLNISKNKLTGDEDTEPELRHGRADVIIRPDIARYEDYGE